MNRKKIMVAGIVAVLMLSLGTIFANATEEEAHARTTWDWQVSGENDIEELAQWDWQVSSENDLEEKLAWDWQVSSESDIR